MTDFRDAIIEKLANEAVDKICKKTISSLIYIKTTLSGDDSGLENAWDEICVQVQFQSQFIGTAMLR